MRLFVPEYYKEFKCIKDRCAHSCCVGWEIDVDEKTVGRYHALRGGYADAVCESIEKDCDGVSHFRMGEGERCPHLTPSGLCRIITELGEGFLCDICREHPRFYNYTARGREVGLGMVCEEAARIILASDGYSSTVDMGEALCGDISQEVDTVSAREGIYAILSDRSVPYSERLSLLSQSYGVSASILSDEEWRGVISSLEYLDESHKELFLSYSSSARLSSDKEVLAERALAYFIYRHTGGAQCEGEFRSALGFAFFLERLFASLLQSAEPCDAVDIARIISEEIEYSEENTENIMMEFDFAL